nr:M14 family zinc carboxypeptidase [Wenzhouxiangella sp. XN79A]
MLNDFIDGTVVGQTRLGRDIWAYAITTPAADTPDGGPKSSALINGGIHAREWGTPELTTGLIEGFAAGAGDGWLYDYLLDHVRFTVLPVNNIDGFLQTQRYPTEVLVGEDPRTDQWPRDGRMRRKNLLDADEVLDTVGDHLFGVDLNRNNPPFFDPGGWTDVETDLTYHGPFAQSEPETRALAAAAVHAGEDRLRWYQDTHSFTQLFFSSRTENDRRNSIQDALLSTYSRFHDALSEERHGHGRLYRDVRDPIGAGIGTTAEYFAYAYQIPSWTLEIEPANGGEDYGGFGANHDGFILPESEVARLREDMAITHAVVAYRMAGPPSVRTVEIHSSDGRWPVLTAEWTRTADGQRSLEARLREPLLPGLDYRLRITFDKPMRWLDRHGEVRTAPGHSVRLEPLIWLGSPTAATFSVDTSAGRWQVPGDRYATDTFEVVFQLPESLDPGAALASIQTLVINASDFTGQPLDSDPSTAVDWADGGWTGYENSQGTPGDSGGSDATLSVLTTTRGLARIWLRRRG